MLIWFIIVSIVSVSCGINKFCPDHSSSCPDFATCCELADESYGCCPLENAVCCDDHIHCCPENTKCEAGACLQLDGLNGTAKKLSPKDDVSKYCFQSKFTCPDLFTCCKGLDKGEYGCCPLDDAVCCEDGQSCCPHNTVCDVEHSKCISDAFVTEMYDSQKHSNYIYNFTKFTTPLAKLSKPNNVSSVVCPGSSFQCPNGYTCCQLPSGDWGCCPFPKATCCNDHLHCCPENMKCDASSQACSQGQVSIPSLQKVLSKPVNVGMTCPDNSTCAESMTCCRLGNKHFGCCPYVDAVCCGDHSHCCPNGYICDLVEKNCVPKQNWLSNFVSKYYKKLG